MLQQALLLNPEYTLHYWTALVLIHVVVHMNTCNKRRYLSMQ